MNRMSARYIGIKVGLTTKEVYNMWKQMGLVAKDKFGDWVLTDMGRGIGGKMSNGNRLSVPTFDFQAIENRMIDFYKKMKNNSK